MTTASPYFISSEAPQFGFDRKIPPALEVESGSVVSFQTDLSVLDRLAAGESPAHFEVHPEVSLAGLCREIEEPQFLASKKSWTGLQERLRLLGAAGITVPADLGPPGAAGPDDVVDAALAAWSASRKAAGIAVCLPDQPEEFPSGRSAIWY